MDWIFEYEESDGSQLAVGPMDDKLWFKAVSSTGISTVSVDVAPQAVNQLHAALGAWMAERGVTARSAVTPEPVYGPDSLIGQLITQAVAAEVARVLPLHQAPVAAAGFAKVAPEDAPCRSCQSMIWHTAVCPVVRCDGTACCTPHPLDPEPHDVGHPTLEDARPHPQDHGRLMAELPRRAPRCADCGHSWVEHMEGVCWGSGENCDCANERPAPVPVTRSDKVWGEQGASPGACTECPHLRSAHTRSGGCGQRDLLGVECACRSTP